MAGPALARLLHIGAVHEGHALDVRRVAGHISARNAQTSRDLRQDRPVLNLQLRPAQ